MSGPLNIAHILPWPTLGGVEIGTLRAAKLVEGENFRSIAYCLKEAAPVRGMFEASGFPVATYDLAQPSYRHPTAFWRASRSLAADLRRRRIDIVHCSDLLAAYYATLAGKLAGIPVLCHIRGTFDEISRRDQSFLWWVDHYVFVSENVRKLFAYRAGAKSGSVIFDGVSIPETALDGDGARAEFGIPRGAPVVGMVARIAPQKDHATLVRAAVIVLREMPEVRFLMVGDHSSTTEYREHYQSVQAVLNATGVQSSFIFTDLRQDVNRLMAAMDVCALSTNSEGFPLVLLESMALVKPVVATEVGGIPELIREGENGLMHRHADAEDLAAKLLSLLQHPERARVIAEHGHQDILTRFNPANNSADLQRVYRKLARRRAPVDVK
jgi:glycosyltransferase involved in cell wall biosynthesis